MLEGNGDSLPHSEIDESRNGKKDPILLIMNVTYYLFAGTFTRYRVVGTTNKRTRVRSFSRREGVREALPSALDEGICIEDQGKLSFISLGRGGC